MASGPGNRRRRPASGLCRMVGFFAAKACHVPIFEALEYQLRRLLADILAIPGKDTNTVLYLVAGWQANTKYRLTSQLPINRIPPPAVSDYHRKRAGNQGKSTHTPGTSSRGLVLCLLLFEGR